MDLMEIAYDLNFYLTPLIILFGVIGNILSILIFTRPSLRRSCSIYFLCASVNGLVILLFGATTRWITVAYPNYDLTRTSISFCRFRAYIVYVIYNLAPYFTACITIDRYCSSSPKSHIRRFSSRIQIAYIVVPIVILMTSLAYIHMVIGFTIKNFSCQPSTGFYGEFFPFFTTIYYCFAIIIIVIFGLGTSYNIRVQKEKIQSILSLAEKRRNRSDAQLLILLLVHIICYATLALPYHISLIIGAIKPTLYLNITFKFIQHIAVVTLNLSQSINFYIFTLTASLYRKELKNILCNAKNSSWKNESRQRISANSSH